jgi:hypothetical protein
VAEVAAVSKERWLHRFLGDEERAGNIVFGCLAGILWVCFVLAVAAVVVMR